MGIVILRVHFFLFITLSLKSHFKFTDPSVNIDNVKQTSNFTNAFVAFCFLLHFVPRITNLDRHLVFKISTERKILLPGQLLQTLIHTGVRTQDNQRNNNRSAATVRKVRIIFEEMSSHRDGRPRVSFAQSRLEALTVLTRPLSTPYSRL